MKPAAAADTRKQGAFEMNTCCMGVGEVRPRSHENEAMQKNFISKKVASQAKKYSKKGEE
jgi:hypothetical protein